MLFACDIKLLLRLTIIVKEVVLKQLKLLLDWFQFKLFRSIVMLTF